MAGVVFSPRAYCKIILHAAKYPHCSINGLLLAKQRSKHEAKTTDLYIEDAIPLFHICLYVTPMTEVALTMVDEMTSKEGLEIVGYYMANETVHDLSIDKAHKMISDKIAENYNGAVLALIDNKEITLGMYSNPLRIYQYLDGKWKMKDKSNVNIDGGDTVTNAIHLFLKDKEYKNLVDFDNHFDNIALDWKNLNINESVLTMMGQEC